MGKRLRKVTVGFVVQEYVELGDTFVCVGQEFVCGDEVTWETPSGVVVDCPEGEVYQPFLMVQPLAYPGNVEDVGGESGFLLGSGYRGEEDALGELDEELREEQRRDEKRGLYPDVDDPCN